jgi:hypothetical protein
MVASASNLLLTEASVIGVSQPPKLECPRRGKAAEHPEDTNDNSNLHRRRNVVPERTHRAIRRVSFALNEKRC